MPKAVARNTTRPRAKPPADQNAVHLSVALGRMADATAIIAEAEKFVEGSAAERLARAREALQWAPASGNPDPEASAALEARLRVLMADLGPMAERLLVVTAKHRLQNEMDAANRVQTVKDFDEWKRAIKICNSMENPLIRGEPFIRALTMIGGEGMDRDERAAIHSVAEAALSYFEDIREAWNDLHDAMTGKPARDEGDEDEEDQKAEAA